MAMNQARRAQTGTLITASNLAGRAARGRVTADMLGNLVDMVAIRGRAEPGDLYAAGTSAAGR
jgi:hypothetical protein